MLQIGTVPFLVAKPLTAGLERAPGVTLHQAAPAQLVRDLAAGRLDVALASSVICTRVQGQADGRFLLWEEGPVIAARRNIHSVLLFLRPGLAHPGAVRSLITDRDSRTGRALARIVLQQGFRASFVEQPSPPDADPFQLGADAVQRIGDAALAAARTLHDWQVLDLCAGWNDLTGLPFVFAGWIGREGFDPASAADLLLPAAEAGLSGRPALIDEAVRRHGHERDFLEQYLLHDVAYRLPAQDVRCALEEFGKRLRRTSAPTARTTTALTANGAESGNRGADRD